MNATFFFIFLLNLEANELLETRLMNVMATYLCSSLANNIYGKILEGSKFPKGYNPTSQETYSIKMRKSLCGLKQTGRM